MPLLQYDRHSPEDLDTEMEDHAADEARYLCMARPMKPRAKEGADPYEKNPAHLYLNMEKTDFAGITARPRMEILEETSDTNDKGRNADHDG